MNKLDKSTKDKFLTFNSGVVSFYRLVNVAQAGNKPLYERQLIARMRFDYETLGMNRFYTALQADIKLDELIITPLIRSVSTQDIAVINNIDYRIEQVQHVSDTKPPASRFSLSKIQENGGVYDSTASP